MSLKRPKGRAKGGTQSIVQGDYPSRREARLELQKLLLRKLAGLELQKRQVVQKLADLELQIMLDEAVPAIEGEAEQAALFQKRCTSGSRKLFSVRPRVSAESMFGKQMILELTETRNYLINGHGRPVVPDGHGSRDHAMEVHQLLDFCKGEAKFLIALDENHPFAIILVITSVPAFIPQWCWQQALPFVKTNRLDVYSRAARQIADVHVSFSTLYLGTRQAGKRKGKQPVRRGSTVCRPSRTATN